MAVGLKWIINKGEGRSSYIVNRRKSLKTIQMTKKKKKDKIIEWIGGLYHLNFLNFYKLSIY